MKREDVKNKITGITEEQPNWLMQENGSDITREKFLSTLSLRRATTCYCSGSLICNFYPRSPCGERLTAEQTAREQADISIHALLAESDRQKLYAQRLFSGFLSTLSLRRATRIIDPTYGQEVFLSTLSLRRATIVTVGLLMFSLYFYPRSPCGERQHQQHNQ